MSLPLVAIVTAAIITAASRPAQGQLPPHLSPYHHVVHVQPTYHPVAAMVSPTAANDAAAAAAAAAMSSEEEESLYRQVQKGIIRLPGGSNEFRIPIMVPLHKVGRNPNECSYEPNPAALNDLKAALWAIDKINSEANFVDGVKFGAVVVDTCSSPTVAANRLSQYLSEEANHIIGRITLEKTDPAAAQVISELSSALNRSTTRPVDLETGDHDGARSAVPVGAAKEQLATSVQTPILVNSGEGSGATFGVVDSPSSDSSKQVTASSSSAGVRRTWGVVVSIASGLGVLVVLMCSVYFLMVFRVTVGTTILGYFILLGLFMLYSVNFAFVLPPSMGVCWLRRLGMSVAYCTILSGMLVKVMNTWRLMAYRKTEATDLKLTSPFGLLFISGGLVAVQVFVTVTWLVLFPPQPGQYDGSWRCSAPSPSDFLIETESVVSLLYVVLLVVITLFFGGLTWKCHDNNREPRYIMGCCGAAATAWLLWTASSYQINRKRFSDYRDMTIICANLASATIIMVCLYLRKLYLYNQLKRNHKHLSTRLQRSAFPGNFYGAFGSANPTSTGSLRMWDAFSYGSAGAPSTAASSVRGSVSSVKSLKATHSGGKGGGLAAAATRPPFEEDDMDDGTASCGSAASSVQVQGHDLYPMEVYDGGSQFQPSSLFASANAATVTTPGKSGLYDNHDNEPTSAYLR